MMTSWTFQPFGLFYLIKTFAYLHVVVLAAFKKPYARITAVQSFGLQMHSQKQIYITQIDVYFSLQCI